MDGIREESAIGGGDGIDVEAEALEEEEDGNDSDE